MRDSSYNKTWKKLCPRTCILFKKSSFSILQRALQRETGAEKRKRFVQRKSRRGSGCKNKTEWKQNKRGPHLTLTLSCMESCMEKSFIERTGWKEAASHVDMHCFRDQRWWLTCQQQFSLQTNRKMISNEKNKFVFLLLSFVSSIFLTRNDQEWMNNPVSFLSSFTSLSQSESKINFGSFFSLKN